MADQWIGATPLDNWIFATDDPNEFDNWDGEKSTSTDPVNDPPPGMTGVGQTWRTLTPTHPIDFVLEVMPNGPQSVLVVTAVWSRIDDVWATVVASTVPSRYTKIETNVEVGVTYYVMFALADVYAPVPPIIWWATLNPLPTMATMPALGVQAGFSVSLPPRATVNVPPISTHVAVPVALLGPPPFSGSITPTAPAQWAALPTNTPQFTVAVTSTDPLAIYTVEVQYADNQEMTSPTKLTGTTDAVTGGVVLTPATPVPAVTYWQTRLRQDGFTLIDWSVPFVFTVASAPETVTLPVSWTVDPAAERPIHVWHFDPAGPLDGDTVTIYGQGFPGSGTLSYGDIVLSTTGWQLVAQAPENADDSTRVIDGSTVTCEHYEVQFVAPVDDGPGEALVLEG